MQIWIENIGKEILKNQGFTFLVVFTESPGNSFTTGAAVQNQCDTKPQGLLTSVHD